MSRVVAAGLGPKQGGLGNPLGQEQETLLRCDLKQNLHSVIFFFPFPIFLPVRQLSGGKTPENISLGVEWVGWVLFLHQVIQVTVAQGKNPPAPDSICVLQGERAAPQMLFLTKNKGGKRGKEEENLKNPK